MRLLFTAGNSPIGNAIRYLTREPMSHVAIESNGWVIHSSIWGPEIRTLVDFTAHYNIVAEVELPVEVSPARAYALISKYDRRLYDYSCLVFLGLRYVALRYLGISLPKVNLWQISGMYTCTEFVSELVFGYEDSLITPYGLYHKLGGKPLVAS
jgi:hypothetical protein